MVDACGVGFAVSPMCALSAVLDEAKRPGSQLFRFSLSVHLAGFPDQAVCGKLWRNVVISVFQIKSGLRRA